MREPRFARLIAATAVALVLSPGFATSRDVPSAARSGSGSTFLGTGWVVYDPGPPADRFLERGGSYPLADYFGNVFDPSRGHPLHSGTISQIGW